MNSRITIYDGTGRDRLSLSAWKVMFRELRDFRELIVRLVVRNFSAQFRQSFLGYAWIVFPPIATALVFALLRQAQIVNIPMEGRTIPYVLFALIGVTVWTMFTQFVLATTGSIANAGGLVSKVYFPREVLVLSGAGNALINTLVRLLVVVISFFLMGFFPPWPVLFAPLLLVPVIFLAVGMGLFLAPINTMMHDTGRAMEVLFQFGMLMAPTVYPTPDLGSSSSLSVQLLFWIHTLNPVSHTLYAIHGLIETGVFVPTAGWCASTLISFVVFFLGWRFFHVCEPLLAERL